MPFSWDAFLARYGPMARALVRPLVRPPATPDDVVQEAALALHRAMRREPERFPEAEGARNYFLRSVRNLARRSARDARREEPLGESIPMRAESDPTGQARLARRRALGKLLLELDPAGRELIARRFLAQQTLARIARETGVPISTLHDREKDVLARLRRRLDALDVEEHR